MSAKKSEKEGGGDPTLPIPGKCGHCGSRDTQTLGHHIRCLVCGGFTNAAGEPTPDAYA